MLNSRLRPLPRRNYPTIDTNTSEAPVPTPNFENKNEPDEEEDQEDIFSSFLGHLFPDDAPAFHGDPGQHLLYSSPRYGNLDIMVPSYPSSSENRNEEIAAGQKKNDGTVNAVDEGRKLFAHFLWSAAMVVAEGVEEADMPFVKGEVESEATKEAREIWGVRGESVLELGAGAALPSVICALANATTVAATDHPSSPALSGAIAFNTSYNLSNRNPPVNAAISMHPHEWGVLSDPFSTANKGKFSRICAADCFWIPEQHENLTRTMQWFLSPGGKVWIVAGFHTGRPIVAQFFETAVRGGFVVERIFERDTVERLEGGGEIRREWMPEREGESVDNRKRWCVVAVLRRAE